MSGPSFDRDLTSYTGDFVTPTQRAIFLLTNHAGLSEEDAWNLLSDVAQEYRDWKEIIGDRGPWVEFCQ